MHSHTSFITQLYLYLFSLLLSLSLSLGACVCLYICSIIYTLIHWNIFIHTSILTRTGVRLFDNLSSSSSLCSLLWFLLLLLSMLMLFLECDLCFYCFTAYFPLTTSVFSTDFTCIRLDRLFAFIFLSYC